MARISRVVGLGATALIVAGCGIRVSPTTSVLPLGQHRTTPSSIQASSPTSPSQTPGSVAPTYPEPVSGGATTTTSTGSSGLQSTTSQIEHVYHSFLALLSGLDDNLTSVWSAALERVATARLVLAAERDAATIAQANEHGVGTLAVDHEVLKMVNSTQASLFGCLDEYDFYLVKNSNGQPDPAISRGDFVGVADLVEVGGQWKVDVWESAQGHCTFSSN